VPEQFRTRYRLEQLRQDAARAAVEKPLEGTVIRFKPGVAGRLVNDLLRIPVTLTERARADRGSSLPAEAVTSAHKRGEFVEPVQLQVACFSLVHKLPRGTTEITKEDLITFGDVDQALGDFYQEALRETAGKAKIDEDSLRQWFETELITEAGSRGLAF